MNEIKTRYLIVPSLVAVALMIFALIKMRVSQEAPPRLGRDIASVQLEQVPVEIPESQSLLERERNMKIRVIQNLKVNFNSGVFELSPGAFRLVDSEGEYQTICDLYSEVEIELRAEGVVINGEFPSVRIRRPCEYEVGNDGLSPLLFPLAEIMNIPTSQKTMEWQSHQIEFFSIFDQWPEDWIVVGLSLKNKETGVSLELTGYEVNFVNGEPIALSLRPSTEP